MPTYLNVKKMYPRVSEPAPPRAPPRTGQINSRTRPARRVSLPIAPTLEDMFPRQGTSESSGRSVDQNPTQGYGRGQNRQQGVHQGTSALRRPGQVLRFNLDVGQAQRGLRRARSRNLRRSVRFVDPLNPIYASTSNLPIFDDGHFRRVIIVVVDHPNLDRAEDSVSLQIHLAVRPFSPVSSESDTDSESDDQCTSRARQILMPGGLEHRDVDSSESVQVAELFTTHFNVRFSNVRSSNDSDSDSDDSDSVTSDEYEVITRDNYIVQEPDSSSESEADNHNDANNGANRHNDERGEGAREGNGVNAMVGVVSHHYVLIDQYLHVIEEESSEEENHRFAPVESEGEDSSLDSSSIDYNCPPFEYSSSYDEDSTADEQEIYQYKLHRRI